MLKLITGRLGPSGFGSASTAERVTDAIDGSNLTAIVTAHSNNRRCKRHWFGDCKNFSFEECPCHYCSKKYGAANEAKQLILKDNKAARVDIEKLDLSSIRSVKAFADKFEALNLPLNILINNAGIMSCPFQLSEDGIEMQFATNHIGHFYLTNLLIEKMKETAKTTGIQGRIVNLSSLLHRYPYKGGIQFHKISDKSSYQER